MVDGTNLCDNAAGRNVLRNGSIVLRLGKLGTDVVLVLRMEVGVCGRDGRGMSVYGDGEGGECVGMGGGCGREVAY